MNRLKIVFTVFLCLALVSYKSKTSSQKPKLLMGALTQTLQKAHYLNKTFDDDFSKEVFNNYINRLDNSKKYFLAKDISGLDTYKYKIDNEVENKTYQFFNQSTQLFNKRLEEAEGYYKDILSEPFDFSKNETFSRKFNQKDYVQSKSALQERWRKLLKYQTLVRLDDKIRANNNKEDEANKEPVDTLEKEARQSVVNSYENLFNRIAELDTQDHRARYLNTISSTYDPHTSYLPPKDKENFDIQMSGSFEGIGATLTKKDGYIEVVRIVVGSASWRQGDLEVGDKIMKVAQEDEEAVNVMDMPLDDAVQLIRGPKGSVVTLTVKKRDGSIEEIPIERDVVEIKETFAKSAVIKNPGKKTGYIRLPKFYMDMNKGKKGRSSYDDVKNQLKQLKNRNVNGVIIDLRNNGGGSLRDAIRMVGLFIEEGPVLQVKSRFGPPKILRDTSDRVFYEEPVVVMVNSISASASEIFAGAIRDYNRGVIIGSSSTFGKGTVQRMINFDQLLSNNYDQYKPLGSLKLTVQKFYRINGEATQVEGVHPDVIVPDRYTYMDIGEGEKKNAMKWDTIHSTNYEKWNPDYDKDAVLQKADKRIDNSENFSLIRQKAKNIKQRSNRKEYSLNLEKFKKHQEELREASEEVSKLKDIETDIEVETFTNSDTEIAEDSVEIERQKRWKKNIKEDIYIEESVRLLNDMI